MQTKTELCYQIGHDSWSINYWAWLGSLRISISNGDWQAVLSGNFRVRFSRTFKYRCLSVFKSGMILQCPVQTSNSEVLDFASLFSDLQASTFVFDLGLLWSQVTGCLPGCGLAYNNRNVLELLELENLTSSNLGSIIIYWYDPFDMPAVFIYFIKSLRKPY